MNQQRIAILTDSGTDVPVSFAQLHDVRTAPLQINYSDGSYRSGIDITTDEVIRRFATEMPTTSLPGPDQIRAVLEGARADGYERALFVTISSGLSATFDTVRLVASQMPDFPCAVIDTKSIGVAAGMVVMAAAELVEAGTPFERAVRRLEELSRDVRVYFTVRDLSYLRHGGRISEATYRLGSLLDLKPVFFCDANGKYEVIKKSRGWNKALKAELDFVRSRARKFEKVVCAVCCTKAEDRLDELAEQVRGAVPDAVKIIKSGISPDLIAHSGPNLVGMGVCPAAI